MGNSSGKNIQKAGPPVVDAMEMSEYVKRLQGDMERLQGDVERCVSHSYQKVNNGVTILEHLNHTLCSNGPEHINVQKILDALTMEQKVPAFVYRIMLAIQQASDFIQKPEFTISDEQKERAQFALTSIAACLSPYINALDESKYQGLHGMMDFLITNCHSAINGEDSFVYLAPAEFVAGSGGGHLVLKEHPNEGGRVVKRVPIPVAQPVRNIPEARPVGDIPEARPVSEGIPVPLPIANAQPVSCPFCRKPRRRPVGI